jgi:hypothetical protein
MLTGKQFMIDQFVNETADCNRSAILFDEHRKVIYACPIKTTWSEFRATFAQSDYRSSLANQLEQYATLCAKILNISHVWIGGSFCGDNPKPNDIDVVVFYRSLIEKNRTSDLLEQTATSRASDCAMVFNNVATKDKYSVDSALVPLSLEPSHLVNVSAFWTLVLSHQKNGQTRPFFCVGGEGLFF